MEWRLAADAPIYSQLAEQMRLSIVSGEYTPGERLPPVRELALSAGVNPNTMQRSARGWCSRSAQPDGL